MANRRGVSQNRVSWQKSRRDRNRGGGQFWAHFVPDTPGRWHCLTSAGLVRLVLTSLHRQRSLFRDMAARGAHWPSQAPIPKAAGGAWGQVLLYLVGKERTVERPRHGSHRILRNVRAPRPPGESPGGQRGDQDAGETPALREASARRCVCRPRQTFRSAGVPPALLGRRTLMCSYKGLCQNRWRPVQERGSRFKSRGIRVTQRPSTRRERP